MDLTGRVRARSVVEEDHRGSDPETVLGKLADQARDVMAELARLGVRPAGATLAVPGLVDEAAGRLMLAPNLRWRDVPVGELVGAALGMPSLPVRVDNEANLAAYAEFRERSGRGVRDLVHVSGQIGVGAGVIADGTPFRGSRGFAGELGHITVDLDGPPCACGNRGCLETVVGQEALLRRARITVPPGVPSRRLTATLVQRARAGDAGTLNALRAGGKALGVALATVANLCDPQVIVLGGSYAELAPWLVPPVRSELRGRVLAARWSPIDVEVSTLGPEAAALGAASLVVGDILADPEAVPVQAA
jgi:predicted NBD/HSP70 family sugar kinase